jgi:WD40-like Beta Propeller Repeat
VRTLEDQLAAYGGQRNEGQTPFTTEELSGRSARHDPSVPSGLRTGIGDNSGPVFEASPRSARVSSRSVPRRLAGWQVGVAIATITLLGFGLINVFAGSGGPSDIQRTVGQSSETTVGVASNTEAAGSRSVNVDGISISFETLASGWESSGDFLISKDLSGDQAAEAVIYFATFPGVGAASRCPDLPFGQLPESADIDVVARSLSSTVDSKTVVGGMISRFVEVGVGDAPVLPPTGAVFVPDVGCDPGYLYSWAPQSGGASWRESKAGDTIDAWFVEVDGAVLVIVAETRGHTVRRELGPEIFQIVDSIRFPSIAPIATADYIIDMDTGEMTLLPAAIRSLAPSQYAVSPSGSMVAFLAPDDDGGFQLFTAGIDGADIRQITQRPNEAGSPAWSPDGSMVAYADSEGLFVLDVASGESTQIPSVLGTHYDGGIQFTPDGSSILYSSDDYQLWTVPIKGGNPTVLMGLEQGVAAGVGSISPDGSMVTFLGNRINGPGALRFLADTDSFEPRELGGDSQSCGWVNPAGAWSPDGTRILCTGRNDVHAFDVATGDTPFVAEGKGGAWLDDHTLLVEAWGK